MLPKNTFSIGLRRTAALFALLVILFGTAAAPLPQDETPPGDVKTPAMLRAEDLYAQPIPPLQPSAQQATAQPDEPRLSLEEDEDHLDWNSLCQTGSMSWTYFTGALYDQIGRDWDIVAKKGCWEKWKTRTSNTAADYLPRLSFDSQKVVYVSDASGNDEIFTKHLVYGTTRKLTNHSKIDTMPTWSPDGLEIAFVSTRSGFGEVYTMASKDGSSLKRLTNFQMSALYPEYSLDGSKIVFTLRGGDMGQIVVMDSNGKNAYAVTAPLALLGKARWSADGKRLAFEYDSNGDGWIDLGVVNSNGTGMKRIYKSTKPIDAVINGWFNNGEGLFISYYQYTEYRSGRWYLDRTIYGHMYLDIGPGGVNDQGEDIENRNLLLYMDLRNPDYSAPVSRIRQIQQKEIWVRSGTSFPITVELEERVSGVKYLSLDQAAQPEGPRTNYRTYYFSDGTLSTTLGAYAPTGKLGENYVFVQAEDVTELIEPEHTVPDLTYYVYGLGLEGEALDVRNHPVGGARFTFNPASLNNPITDTAGKAPIYLTGSGYYNISVSKAGLIMPEDLTHDFSNPQIQEPYQSILQAGDDQIHNGNFNAANPLQDWITDGKITSRWSSAGGYSARIYLHCGIDLCLKDPENIPSSPADGGSIALDHQGAVHAIAESGEVFYRPAEGGWQFDGALPAGSYQGLTIAPDDTQYAIRIAPEFTLYRKVPGGDWAEMDLPQRPAGMFAIRVDELGTLHIAYPYQPEGSRMGLYYSQLLPEDTWRQPALLSTLGVSTTSRPALISTQDGMILAVYAEARGELHRVDFNPLTGEASVKTFSGTEASGYRYAIPQLVAGPDGRIHLAVMVEKRKLNSGGYHQVIMAASRSSEGQWDYLNIPFSYEFDYPITPLDESVFNAPWVSITVGNDQWIHLVALQQGIIRYTKKNPSSGSWVSPHDFTEGRFSRLSAVISPEATVHLLLGSATGMTYYSRDLVDRGESGSISQTITLPETMHKPTLSYRYEYDRDGTFLEAVVLEEGKDPVVLDSAVKKFFVGPSHAWSDLTPWLGKTITIQLRYRRNANVSSASIETDDISVTSWTSPILQSISPQKVEDLTIGEAWITITGENLMEGSRVFFGSTEALAVEFDEETGTYRALVDPSMPIGRYDVRVVTPNGTDESLPGALSIGHDFWVPFIR